MNAKARSPFQNMKTKKMIGSKERGTMTRCEQCGYFWKGEGDDFAGCHYDSLGEWDPAPCEYDGETEDDHMVDGEAW